jgi:hypothetical protein
MNLIMDLLTRWPRLKDEVGHYFRKLTVRPTTESELDEQRMLHETVQLEKNFKALLAVLLREKEIPDALMRRAVEVVRNHLLTHPEIKEYLREFEAADKLVQEFRGQITETDRRFVTVAFEIDGRTEVRQFPRKGIPNAWDIGQQVLARCTLQVLPYSEPLDDREKQDFDAAGVEVKSLWQAMVKKAKPFSDAT